MDFSNINATESAYLQSRFRLSPRETELALLLLEGVDSNADIARRMRIKLNSAKVYSHNLFAKLGVSSKLAAAMKLIHELHASKRKPFKENMCLS
jgi:DNA-binding CsgD family transcriptional regulator